MLASRRIWGIALCGVAILATILACSLPGRLLSNGPTPAGQQGGEGELIGHRGAWSACGAWGACWSLQSLWSLQCLWSLGWSPIRSRCSTSTRWTGRWWTRSASGLSWAQPNTAQVVGEDIYYVDSSGASPSGVVRRVTASETHSLDFTAADSMANLTFAVSADGSRIAWTHSIWTDTGVDSSLWVANIDGSEITLAQESETAAQPDAVYALEVVGWTTEGDLIYAWQITGIGGYILFSGYSSLYRYSPTSGTITELAPIEPVAGAPCWSGTSGDGAYGVGDCGTAGEVVERDLTTGEETAFPTLKDQGQAGAGAYSPSGNRLGYAIASGNSEDESGQVVVRVEHGQDPGVIATQAPGYFERLSWIDDDRLLAGYASGETAQVDMMQIDGDRLRVGDGRLIGVIRPAAEVAVTADVALPDPFGGGLTVGRVTANGDIAGPGIKVVVRNPGPTDLQATIPCGFVFEPGNSGDQRLMVVQEASAMVPAGGETTLTAFVICIDPDSAAPSEGAGYATGGMELGDLLQLAQCACGEDLGGGMDPLAGIGLMSAGWTIRNGGPFSSMMDEEAAGAMSQFFGEDSGYDLAEVLEMLEEPATEWLDRCGIQVP